MTRKCNMSQTKHFQNFVRKIKIVISGKSVRWSGGGGGVEDPHVSR